MVSCLSRTSEDKYRYCMSTIYTYGETFRGVKLLILLTYFQFVVQISACGIKLLLPVVCDAMEQTLATSCLKQLQKLSLSSANCPDASMPQGSLIQGSFYQAENWNCFPLFFLVEHKPCRTAALVGPK